MLTAKEAFKIGFLAKCAEDGLTPDEMLSRVTQAKAAIEKRAFIGGLLGSAAGAVGGAAKNVAGYGIPLALAAPPILGGLAGYGLAKATDVDDTDVEDIKNRELVEEYKRQAAKLQQQNAVRRFKQDRVSHARPLM